MLVILAGKAGVLADHDGLAGVDVLEHPDNEDGLAVVTRVVTRQIPVCAAMSKLSLPVIFLQYNTDCGGGKARRGDGEN